MLYSVQISHDFALTVWSELWRFPNPLIWVFAHVPHCYFAGTQLSYHRRFLTSCMINHQDFLLRWFGASANMYLSLKASANSSLISESCQWCVGKFCRNIRIPWKYKMIPFQFVCHFKIRPQGYKTFFSCSTQLSMKFQLLLKPKILKNRLCSYLV